MSEMETHIGRLVPMNLRGVTLEERAYEACRELKLEREDFHSSWVNCLNDKGYMKAHIQGHTIYRVLDKELDSTGFIESSAGSDGTIDYIVSYYNGGASFSEVLEAALEFKEADQNG